MSVFIQSDYSPYRHSQTYPYCPEVNPLPITMATGNDIELKGLSNGGGKGKQQKLSKERSVVDKKTLQLL